MSQKPQVTAFANSDLEKEVLGSMLIDTSAIGRVADMLDPSDFALPQHQTVYAAMLRLRDAGRPTELPLVIDELNGDIETAGGYAYLASLGILTGTSLSVLYYAERLRELAQRRALASAARDIHSAAAENSEAAIAKAEAIVLSARRRQPTRAWTDKADALDAVHERLTGPLSDDDAGIPMGIAPLDSLLHGMHRGDLIVVGARPSVGKTSLAVTAAHHVAVALNQPVAFFSLEMLRERILEKLLAISTGMTYGQLTSHDLSADVQSRLAHAVEELKAAPIDVVPAREWTMPAIRAAARDMAQHGQLGLIVVDYLQIIASDGRRENRTQEVSSISAQLKHMALEMECPVLALSQLNREPEHRPNSPPIMSELRESGSIEQDADVVLLLSRPKEEEDHAAVRPVVAHVAKNRMGETGKRIVGFRAAHMEFVPLEQSQPLTQRIFNRGRAAACPSDEMESY